MQFFKAFNISEVVLWCLLFLYQSFQLEKKCNVNICVDGNLNSFEIHIYLSRVLLENQQCDYFKHQLSIMYTTRGERRVISPVSIGMCGKLIGRTGNSAHMWVVQNFDTKSNNMYVTLHS